MVKCGRAILTAQIGIKGVGFMAHVAKFGRAAVGNLARHFERAKGKDGEYVRFSNQSIDQEKTPENYNLAPARDISQGEFIRQRCTEVKCLKRKDVNVMCAWVVTAPKGVAGSQDERKFFQETYNFLEEQYGKENVVSAYVHKDEVTPHMHFAFVPVVADRRSGELKVSAKECLTRKHLQAFHGDLSRHLERTLGRDVGVLNEATKEGNKSIEELKRGTAVKQLAEIRGNITQTQNELSELQKRVLDAKEVRKLAEKGKKGMFGGLHGVSYAEFEQLKETAAHVDEMKEQVTAARTEAEKTRETLKSEQKQIDKYVEQLNNEAERLNNDRAKLEEEKTQTPTRLMMDENKKLREKNKQLERALRGVKTTLLGAWPELKRTLAPEKLERVNEAISIAKELDQSRGRGR